MSFGVINLLLFFFLSSVIKNNTLNMILLVFSVIDIWRWWKRIVKHASNKRTLISTCKNNNAFVLVGGIGTGKSTLAEFLKGKLVTNPDNVFYNCNQKGAKALTHRHLLLLDKLPQGSVCICDEVGQMYNSFRYSTKDADWRERVVMFNKLYRQFYKDNSYIMYIDQCESNVNTAILRSLYYCIHCKSCGTEISALLPYLVWEFFATIKSLFTKKPKKLNPFQLVYIEYMEFTKLGDFAEHYSVTIKDEDHKKLYGSVQSMFGHHNTYVFEKFNPAVETNYYIWGTNEETDNAIMNQNFDLQTLAKDLSKFSGFDVKKYY